MSIPAPTLEYRLPDTIPIRPPDQRRAPGMPLPSVGVIRQALEIIFQPAAVVPDGVHERAAVVRQRAQRPVAAPDVVAELAAAPAGFDVAFLCGFWGCGFRGCFGDGFVGAYDGGDEGAEGGRGGGGGWGAGGLWLRWGRG